MNLIWMVEFGSRRLVTVSIVSRHQGKSNSGKQTLRPSYRPSYHVTDSVSYRKASFPNPYSIDKVLSIAGLINYQERDIRNRINFTFCRKSNYMSATLNIIGGHHLYTRCWGGGGRFSKIGLLKNLPTDLPWQISTFPNFMRHFIIIIKWIQRKQETAFW